MMDRETNDLLARLYLSEKNLSHIEPREFVEWAALELERGNDRDSVRRLGGMTGSDDLSKIGQQFRDCIADLGWEIPKNKAVMKRHAESTLQSIVDGTIEPYYGCSHLYVISIYLGHPDFLFRWDEIFWAREDLEIEEMNLIVTQEARRSLGLEAPEERDDDSGIFEDEEEPVTLWTRIKELLGLR